MGDVVEQPIGNAKATFSSNAASQGQQTTHAAKKEAQEQQGRTTRSECGHSRPSYLSL
jgi:hypothetical protein